MTDVARIVVVGAGHAGGAVVAMLRQSGWQGAITLIGEEALPPYERPPLSKAWLKGEVDDSKLLLRPAQFYADNDIALRLSTRVVAIDRAARRVRLDDGAALPYDHLILALGSRARHLPLPGIDLAGVLELRTVVDADRLKAALGPGRRIAIIGGGYIGLEVASSARALGAEAIVLEREDRLLARVACPILSDFFLDYHRARGVAFELGCRIEALVGDTAGAVNAVRLSDGRMIGCDAALVGVGAVANDALAREAGLIATTASSSIWRRARTIRRSSPSATARAGRCRFMIGASGWKACRTRWNRRRRPPPRSAKGRRPRPRCRGSGPISTTGICRSPACRSTRHRPCCAAIQRRAVSRSSTWRGTIGCWRWRR